MLRHVRARNLTSRGHARVRQFSTSHDARRAVKILGLESSADDTCAAIVDFDRRIHANVVLRQTDLLGDLNGAVTNVEADAKLVAEKYGGIQPLHATARHQSNMVSFG